MFSYDEIQKYNETDMLIYRYIISNAEKVPYMTIRELAGEIHTSPGAILRFCSKNSFQGYAELKEALRRQNQTLQRSLPSSDLQELSAFFERTNCSAFEEKLAPAVSIIRQAEPVLFAGKGSSGTLARYGARYFSNLGKFSVGLEDTCYPVEMCIRDRDCSCEKGSPGEKVKGRILFHAGDDPACGCTMQQKTNEKTGEDSQQGDSTGLLRQKDADLPGRHAEGFDLSKKQAVLAGSDMDLSLIHI